MRIAQRVMQKRQAEIKRAPRQRSQKKQQEELAR